MNQSARIEALKEYIERKKQILSICAPQLDQIVSAEDYRVTLLHSFREIGELGKENIATLEQNLLPLLEKGRDLSAEELEDLRSFGELLIDTTNMESLDLPLIYRQAERILENAEQSRDLRSLVLANDSMVIAAYMMLIMTIRLYPERDDCFRYRDVGLESAKRLLSYLPPEQFDRLPDDECRELVLINSRYIRCLFEWGDKENPEYYNRHDIRLMREALALAENPYYREKMPEYRWDAHVFRTLQYLADFTEGNNKHGFNREQLEELYGYTLRLIDFLKEHPEMEEGCPKTEQELYLLRNSYLVDKISAEEYRHALIRILKEGDEKDFSACSMFIRFTAPMEYILTLDRDHLEPEQKEALTAIYEHMAAYAYHMPKTGVLSFMLTFLSDFLKGYIEVPNGISFRDMSLQILAAMHPPTYVHTQSVAAIARYLAEQLIEREPERFLGIADAKDAEEVRERREKILEFIYQSALLHDIGKLFIIETIMTYGRNLIDSEIDLIRAHTTAGAALLRRFPNTAEYAEVALLHHRWYDDSHGYPEEYRIRDAKYATAVAILEAADCLDAATDSVGRSYKQGKTFEEYMSELTEGSGTRYASFVVDLCRDPEIRSDLEKMLPAIRDRSYRNTYSLLKQL